MDKVNMDNIINQLIKNNIIENQKSALTWAVKEAYFDMVKYLVENGANINNDILHQTVSRTYIYQTHIEIVDYLIKHGADINKIDEYMGYTPLCCAIHHGCLEMVKYLIENGANTNNNNLHIACRYNHFEIVKYLVELGVDVNSMDNNGTTPLILASKNKNIDMVKYLVEHKADVNPNFLIYEYLPLNDKTGPLHWASMNGMLNIVKYLVEHGAHTDVVNNDGYTPLDYAKYFRHLDVIEYLLNL
jgi:ankyrin repeat protein